ncbi:hypothetical protein PDIDSM_437 [Penicillium digitatum]|nr:hypothetical protein PDIDSM_437 [Penicillium digitatum]
MHGHAHHSHARKVEELEERGEVVIVYKTMAPDFEGKVGGYVTGVQPLVATEVHAGVGAPVSAPARTKEQTTETQAIDEATTTNAAANEAVPTDVTTTEAKEEPTTIKETVAHTTHGTEAETTEVTKAETTDKKITITSESGAPITATSFVTSASPPSDSSQNVNDLFAATSTGSAKDSAVSASSTALGFTTSEGMTSGAKAGVAIGVIFGIGVIAALIFFFVYKKKRRQEGYQPENEKTIGSEGLPDGIAASFPPPPPPPSKPQTPSTPPQLNVRPVTQFAPDLSASGGLNPATDGASKSLSLATAAVTGAAAGSAACASRSLTDDFRPPTPPKSAGSDSNPFSDPVNPFNPATTSVTQTAHSVVEPATGPSASTYESSGSTVTAAAVGVTAEGVAAGVAAPSSRSSNDSERYHSAESRSHSPTGSTQSVTAPADAAAVTAVAAGAGAAGARVAAGAKAAGPAPPNNVYRVQMDFNPSMDDELELRSGALVRMVYEYDDGWALCMRLNSPQQGVVPRSCLSARPVMPRARPPRALLALAVHPSSALTVAQ